MVRVPRQSHTAGTAHWSVWLCVLLLILSCFSSTVSAALVCHMAPEEITPAAKHGLVAHSHRCGSTDQPNSATGQNPLSCARYDAVRLGCTRCQPAIACCCCHPTGSLVYPVRSSLSGRPAFLVAPRICICFSMRTAGRLASSKVTVPEAHSTIAGTFSVAWSAAPLEMPQCRRRQVLIGFACGPPPPDPTFRLVHSRAPPAC